MSVKSDGEHTDGEIRDEDRSSRRFSAGRRWSSSLNRSRKGSSKIATVKPVTKCLSSSEEELSKFPGKASPSRELGSTSPRIARLLSIGVGDMEKDAIVAELEKCLTELECEDSNYKPLMDEYSRIEEERDELASELENAFEDLEGYMQHVKKVEAEKKELEAENDELSKECENLKYCLTNRQQIQETGLRKDKRTLEAQLKEITEENCNMKEQINELLEERQSLIQSLMNLHSAEVDDVIHTRSRSCSTVSMESVGSAFRSEFGELRERMAEAEEAEVKLTDELVNCRGLLKEALEDKACLEDENEAISDELSKLGELNESLRRRIEELEAKSKANNMSMKKESGKQQDDSLPDNITEKIDNLQEKISKLKSELSDTQKKCEEHAFEAAENRRKLLELKEQKHEEAFKDEIKKLEQQIAAAKHNGTMLAETENKLRKTELSLESMLKDKQNLEKQMAEIGQKLLSERARNLQEKKSLKDEVDKAKVVLEANEIELRKLREAGNELSNVRSERDKLNSEISTLRRNLKSKTENFTVKIGKLEREILDLNAKQSVNGDAKAKLQAVENLLEKTKKSHDKVLKENEDYAAELLAVKAKHSQEKSLLMNEREDQEEFVKHLEQRIEELRTVREDLTKAEADRDEMKKTISSLEEEKRELLATANKEKADILAQKDEMANQLVTSEQKLEQRDKHLDEIAQREDKLRQNEFKVRQLEQTLSDSIQDKVDATKRIEHSLQQEVDVFKTEQRKLHKEIKDLQSKLKSQESESKVSKDVYLKLGEQKSKCKDLENDNLRLKKQCKDFEGIVSSLRKEKASTLSELKSLESKVFDLSAEKEETRRQLEKALGNHDAFENRNKDLQTEILRLKDCFNRQMEVTKEAMNRGEYSIEDPVKEGLLNETANVQNEAASNCDNCIDLQNHIDGMTAERKEILQDMQNLEQRLRQSHSSEDNLKNLNDRLTDDLAMVRAENDSLKRKLDSAKTEKNELVEKLKLNSESLSDCESSIGEFQTENSNLKQCVQSLQDELTKARSESQIAAEKTRSFEDNTANTMRSLKARKNELQMLLAKSEHEKKDLEKEAKNLRDQLGHVTVALRNAEEKAYESLVDNLQMKLSESDEQIRAMNLKTAEMELENREKMQKLRESEVLIRDLQYALAHAKTSKDSLVEDLREKLSESDERIRVSNLKAAEMELENREFTRKLHESEVLILDLQRAVARANDVAMEKTLESSRSKHLLEKRFEKMLKENSNLRKQIFYDGQDIDRHARSRSTTGYELQSHSMNGGYETTRDREYEERLKHHLGESPTRSARKPSIGDAHSASPARDTLLSTRTMRSQSGEFQSSTPAKDSMLSTRTVRKQTGEPQSSISSNKGVVLVTETAREQYDTNLHDSTAASSDPILSTRSTRKKSVDELQSSLSPTKDILSRSDSAPLHKRPSFTNQDAPLVKATVTARSLSPPVKYFSDTESLGSKPDSSDGDTVSTPLPPRKPAPPSYNETKRNEQLYQGFAQPERVHRPILLKEIPIPALSPASQRKSPRMTSSNPIQANEDGKKRMEHWV